MADARGLARLLETPEGRRTAPAAPTYATDPEAPSALGGLARIIGGGIKDFLTTPLPRAITDEAGVTHYQGQEVPPGGRTMTWTEQLKGLADLAGLTTVGRGGFNAPPLSKVMEAGQPKRVYRGTGHAYDVEDPTKWDPLAQQGPGAYHTENPRVASGHATGAAPNVRASYLDITRPFDVDADVLTPAALRTVADPALLKRLEGRTQGVSWKQLWEWVGPEATQQTLRRLGYDGLTHRETAAEAAQVSGVREAHRVWIPLDPTQEYSAFTPRAELP